MKEWRRVENSGYEGKKMKFIKIRELSGKVFPGQITRLPWDKGKKFRLKWHPTAPGPMRPAELIPVRYMVLIRCTSNQVTTMCHKMLMSKAGENCVWLNVISMLNRYNFPIYQTLIFMRVLSPNFHYQTLSETGSTDCIWSWI